MNDTTADWLREALLAGEPHAWQQLSEQLPPGLDVPAELIAAARCQDDPPAASQLADWSQQLRRACSRAATARASVVLAAASVLRLSALGHDDEAWGDLLPRWLVPSLAPTERGLGLLALAMQARERLGSDDYAEIMDEAVRLLPAGSVLRGSHLYQYTLYLSLRGMLQRIADLVDLPRPGDQEPEIEPTLLAECFYDAVCCGRTGQATFLEQRLHGLAEAPWQRNLLDLHRVHIPVLDAVLHGGAVPDLPEVGSAAIARALLGGDRVFLESYAVAESRGEISPLLAFDSLRVALALRDHHAARRMLEARAAGIGRHWLDDFFLARVLLLEDKPAEAGETYARAEAAAAKYGAVERLEIELRLASELTRHDCCRLGAAPSRSGDVAAAQQPTETDEALLCGASAAAAGLRQRLADLSLDGGPILIIGLEDGSRPTVAGILQRRAGVAGAVRHVVATTCEIGSAACLAALDEPGTLLLDGVDLLPPCGQAQLAARLQRPVACRLMLGGGPGLLTAAAAGSWRADLFWSLADRRLLVPPMTTRSADLPDIVLALLTTAGHRLRWEAPARRALSASQLPGGWSQLVAIARCLGNRRRFGTLDAGLLSSVLAELTEEMAPAAR